MVAAKLTSTPTKSRKSQLKSRVPKRHSDTFVANSMPVLVNCDDSGANLIEQNDELISKTLGEPIANIINQKSTAKLDTWINSVEFENLLELVDMVSTAFIFITKIQPPLLF